MKNSLIFFEVNKAIRVMLSLSKDGASRSILFNKLRMPVCIMFTVSFITLLNAQERISPLEFNPQLYYKHQAAQGAQKNSISGNYLFIPDTLALPFIDDFSTNRMGKTPGIILDTILRSVELGSEIRRFYITDTAYSFQWVSVDSVTKTPLPPVDSIILNNDCGDVFLSNDTLYTWADYFSYTYDSAGVQTGAQLVSVDSVALNYSVFQVVKDTASTSLWIDDQVFINNTYPVNPISYGVATFDGLNNIGVPYTTAGSSASRPADTLTSKPIDLSAFSTFDNIYLSFFYEPQGLGNYPDEGDSLMLEFKISCESWRTVWAKDGFRGPIDSPVFNIVLIHLDDNFYFNNAFQFRFRNKASVTGNNDHWHIDYVYMNQGITDSVIGDMSVLNPPQNFLKNYKSMPWSQFKGYESTETLDSFNISYRNNYSSPQPLDYVYDVTERLTSSLLFLSPTNLNATIQADSFLYIGNLTSDFIPQPALTQDSVVITLRSYFDNALTGDLTQRNDTASTDVNFLNYFAYDDGSAELSYGLESTIGLKKFAYEFNLNHDDTLRAIQFHFASINYRLTFEEITLFVWSDINFTDNTEDTLWHRPQTTLLYVDEINGFTTYRLDTPVIVRNKFYVGWAQLLDENISVGLDLNSDASSRMFVFTQGQWYQSSLEGDPVYPNVAPMIRPVVGKNVSIIGTGIDSKPVVENGEITFYPNPVSKTLFINVPSPDDYHVHIFDLTGRSIYSNPLSGNNVEVAWLDNGLYLLRLSNLNERKAYSFRFIKLESR